MARSLGALEVSRKLLEGSDWQGRTVNKPKPSVDEAGASGKFDRGSGLTGQRRRERHVFLHRVQKHNKLSKSSAALQTQFYTLKLDENYY
jgi:hypothetical protein